MEEKNDVAIDPHGRSQAAHTPVTLVVDYDAAEDLIADYHQNLSSGAVFLNTTRQFAAGDRLRLVLSFPGLLKPIEVSATVRSIRAGDESSCGISVELDPDQCRGAVRDVVDRVQRRDPGVVSRLIRILVVEDNPHVAQLIRNGLQGSGRREFGEGVAFNFRTVTNGRDALELLRSELFDAVIVDVYLPIMDGADLIAEMRRDDHLCQLPVIAVSAGGQTARNSALAAGADAFLEKPMRLRQIVDAMRKLVDLDGSTARA